MMPLVIRLLLPALVVSFALGGCSNSCPYGSTSGPGAGCKQRPAPSAEERTAALDGSAATKGLAAFKASKDYQREVAGFGVSGWGETTFTIPTGEKGWGKDGRRYVTFDRSGDMPAQDTDPRRNYGTATSDVLFPLSKVDLPVLTRTLAQIAKAAPQARFEHAVLQVDPFTEVPMWDLDYSIGSVEAKDIHGLTLKMDAKGRGLCAFIEDGALPAVKSCRIADMAPPAVGGSGAPSGTPGKAPRAPKLPPGTPDIECVQKAAGDVAKLQKCLK